jgi:hypothetical protein
VSNSVEAGGARLRRASDVAVMQAADLGDRYDRAEHRRRDWPPVRCILIEREVSAGLVVVDEVRGQDTAQVPLAENTTWSRHSRRIEPISRSAKGFCHGLCGAVSSSRILMPFTRRRKASP